MAKWKLTIKAADLWQQHEDLEVNDFAKKLHEKLKSYTSAIASVLGKDHEPVYTEMVDQLQQSDFEDYDDFDNWLSDFYDFCDYHKIWLQTIPSLA